MNLQKHDIYPLMYGISWSISLFASMRMLYLKREKEHKFSYYEQLIFVLLIFIQPFLVWLISLIL